MVVVVREVRVEVFDQTRDTRLLRFNVDDGELLERVLASVEADELVTAAGVYRYGAPELRMAQSGVLLGLGKRLFGFLDGPERWLVKAFGDRPEAVLRVTTGDDRLRHLPWELLAEDSFLAVHALYRFTPVRAVSTVASLAAAVVENRPLRVLFMATSPEGVEPVLDFEDEEARILEATSTAGSELVVEESGSLEGLRYVFESHGPAHFDVLHLSGHATIDDNNQPLFIIEDELGGQATANPEQLAQAIGGRWPRLVFVSGCMTGGAPAEGALPSMCERLVQAGAPLVLGWALPVIDQAASFFAQCLYRALANGQSVPDAVALARHELYAEGYPDWHLLRLYADASPLAPIVTPVGHLGRARIRVLPAASSFLDPGTGVVKVVSRAQFVGRRRLIQRGLKALRAPMSDPASPEGLVLSGMGGLGKSTLASRLLERMPAHQRTVHVGRVDEAALRQMIARLAFPTLDAQQEAAAILNAPQASLRDRVRYLFSGPLAPLQVVFVFDDFEHNLEPDNDGGYRCGPEAFDILDAVLRAIRADNSPSRVIITSRYRFPPPPGTRLQFEALETLTRVELRKKLNDLPNLRPDALTEPVIRDRAIAVAAGNPRLLEWLDTIVGAADLDASTLIAGIEDKAEEFREDILATELLNTQHPDLQQILARINLVELPIPHQAVQAICADLTNVDSHLERAISLGLLETGREPTTNETRYYVSNILRPLLAPLITDTQTTAAAAARVLYQLWWPQQ